MAGEKNISIAGTIHGCTPTQASNLIAGILKLKEKTAPNARGTFFMGNKEDIGKKISNAQNASPKLLEEKKD